MRITPAFLFVNIPAELPLAAEEIESEWTVFEVLNTLLEYQ